jgi:hypothetical protein
MGKGLGEAFKAALAGTVVDLDARRRAHERESIPEAYARRIYAILASHCGASKDDYDRDTFVCVAGVRVREYRFIGSLGQGGKFKNSSGQWYVDCYPENETSHRRQCIDAANRKLRVLRAEYERGDGNGDPGGTEQPDSTAVAGTVSPAHHDDVVRLGDS